jgi:outer membrane protein TolC
VARVGPPGSAGFRQNFSTNATLEQAVFRPRLAAEAQAARAEARAFRADAEQATLDVAFTVVDAYYAQVRAERLVAVQAEQLREASRTARDLRARYAAGAGRRVDALRAGVQEALAEVAVREARAVAAQAATALVAALGVPPGARDSAYALDSVVPRPAPAPASLDSLVTVAEAASPTLRAAAAVVDVRRATVRAARADLLPAVSARGGLGYQQSDLSPRAPFTTFGLSLAWPAFTSGAQQALVRAAEAETRLAEAELEVTRNELRRRLAAAQARWREAERRSQAAAASVAARARPWAILDAAFREGAVLLVEVFTARTDLARAASGEVQALVDAQVARAELALTLGRLPGGRPGARAAGRAGSAPRRPGLRGRCGGRARPGRPRGGGRPGGGQAAGAVQSAAAAPRTVAETREVTEPHRGARGAAARAAEGASRACWDEGDRVRAGQLLATFDNSVQAAELAGARTRAAWPARRRTAAGRLLAVRRREPRRAGGRRPRRSARR